MKYQGKLEEAIIAYRRALALDPDFAEAHHNLGDVLRIRGDLEEALAASRHAIRIRPNFPEAHHNLGSAFYEKGQYDDAASAYRRAIGCRPTYADAYTNLGNALRGSEKLDEAILAYCQALKIDPNFASGHNNLGVALADQGNLDAALASYRRAIDIKPDYADAKLNTAFVLLTRGDYENGWPLLEERWGASGVLKRRFLEPMWDGSATVGKRLLIHAEQGLGDAIQFIRYASMAASRGCHVIVECPQSLGDLFRGAKGVGNMATTGKPLPQFDLHLPMLSQPLIFRTTLENIPNETPYLFADQCRIDAWKTRLGSTRCRLRVGLTGAGNSKNLLMRKRSISPKKLLPLFGIDGIDFFSLQIGRGSDQIQHFPEMAGMIDYTNHIKDFADTAALMMELDLIISVDTAVAHLAGALGRPVWTLLPFAPDWRWGLEREDSPWYPTMRLFRQSRAGEWGDVVERVAAALGELRGEGCWPQ